jgi:ribonuclease-3
MPPAASTGGAGSREVVAGVVDQHNDADLVLAESAADLRRTLNAEVQDALLELALTHRSFAYEAGGLPHNERLEFLGDAVLGVVVTDHLYRRFPDLAEGSLAKLRAAVVNATALADVARGLGIGPALRLGRGEQSTGGRDKSSILADALEAVIGAIYLSTDLERTAVFIHTHFDALIEQAADLGVALDWKTSLQEAAAGAQLGVPDYSVVDAGPDHAKEFTARVKLAGEVFGEGAGRSKKIAEQQAAAAAYGELQARGLVPDA